MGYKSTQKNGLICQNGQLDYNRGVMDVPKILPRFLMKIIIRRARS